VLDGGRYIWGLKSMGIGEEIKNLIPVVVQMYEEF
jgi:hypothetical protein